MVIILNHAIHPLLLFFLLVILLIAIVSGFHRPLITPELFSVSYGVDVTKDKAYETMVECMSITPGNGKLLVTTPIEDDDDDQHHRHHHKRAHMAFDWLLHNLSNINRVMRSDPVIDPADATKDTHVNVMVFGSNESSLGSDASQASIAAALVSLLYQRPMRDGMVVVGELTVSDRLVPLHPSHAKNMMDVLCKKKKQGTMTAGPAAVVILAHPAMVEAFHTIAIEQGGEGGGGGGYDVGLREMKVITFIRSVQSTGTFNYLLFEGPFVTF